MRTWIDERADRDLRQLPCVGRRREITHARLSNAGDRWHEHDLVDMLYLPCAAEYADYVVCEKKMAHYLQRTGRNRPGVGTVVTSLADLLRVLEPQIRS